MTIKILFLSFFLFSLSLSLVGQTAGREYNTNAKARISPHGKIKVQWHKLDWFTDFNAGTRFLGATSNAADLKAGFSANAGYGYLFSNRFGLKGRFDFSTFNFSSNQESDVSSGRSYGLSLEAVTDLLAFTSDKKFRIWRVNLHGGLGLTSYRNYTWTRSILENDPDYFNDPFIKGNEDMGHIIMGITPQYHLSGRWSINADISSFFLIKQSNTFDRFNNVRHDRLGNITTLSLGLTFRP
ncbi:MAG: hypothetical protein R3277_08955 [Brumimicrobium sp.]|nr:hypothetical protein [Brumimicrobium sp.]